MKVLVRIPNWLGDAVMITPTLQILKNNKAEITLVGQDYLKELFNDYKYVVDDTKSAKFRILAVYKLAKSLQGFELAISAQNTLLSALFLFWTNALKRVGFRKNIRSLFLTDAIKYPSALHQVAKYALLAGASNCEEKLYLKVQKKVFTKLTVAVAPGAAFGKAKRWPYFSECLKILTQIKDFDIIILGAGSDQEPCDELAKELNAYGVKYENLVGKTSLTELAQIIGGVNLFLTNDSGPMHISAALNTPCIAIFGSTDADLTGPWIAPKCLVVQNKVDCAPCFKRECRYNSYECLVGVSPKQVANLAIGVLNG